MPHERATRDVMLQPHIYFMEYAPHDTRPFLGYVVNDLVAH